MQRGANTHLLIQDSIYVLRFLWQRYVTTGSFLSCLLPACQGRDIVGISGKDFKAVDMQDIRPKKDGLSPRLEYYKQVPMAKYDGSLATFQNMAMNRKKS